MYRKLGLALAFSPTCTALLAETARLKKLFNSDLVLIHVGVKNEEKETRLNDLLKETGLKKEDISIIWKVGNPSKIIIKTCKKYGVDLLIAGALKKENLINYYIGSVARKILRKSPCSVLIFTEPSARFRKIDNILIDIENTELLPFVIKTGLQQASLRKAKTIHFVRELRLYGLSMSVLSEYSMNELSDHRKRFIAREIDKIEKTIEKYEVTDFDTRVKILTGKAGYELRKYARKINCDLLVMGALENKLGLVDRLFMNNLEFIVEDIPCNLLIVKSKD